MKETTDLTLFIRTSNEEIVGWDRRRIVDALVLETDVDMTTAEEISREVETQIVSSGIKILTTPLVREMVDAKLVERGLEKARRMHTRLGFPLYDVGQLMLHQNKENANLPHGPEGTPVGVTASAWPTPPATRKGDPHMSDHVDEHGITHAPKCHRPGVTVTAQGIQQTPSSNILERLLGINTTSTPITTELMSGTTDTNGEINFMMIEAVKYRISLYKPDVVNQTLEIYPKEDTYPIIISTAGGPLLPDAGDALRDIRINVTTSTEGDAGHIHIDYNDTTRKTTSLTIQVTQQNTATAEETAAAAEELSGQADELRNLISQFKLKGGEARSVRKETRTPAERRTTAKAPRKALAGAKAAAKPEMTVAPKAAHGEGWDAMAKAPPANPASNESIISLEDRDFGRY